MKLVDRAVLPLRVLLAATFCILVVFQLLSMPGQFAHLARDYPDQSAWRWPLTIWAGVRSSACSS